MPRSASFVVLTSDVSDAVLLLAIESTGPTVGSTVAVSVIVVPFAVPLFTCSVSGNESDAPAPNGVAELQLTGPVPPTAGVMHVQPAGGVMPWNVVFGGVERLNDGFAAASLPLSRSVSV